MEQLVIIEKLKDAIGSRKVKAALFYSFNFDARFFENYILTVFLPHVNFSDNEIQNTILWRKYVNELPPVTVYCDFHAKKPDAPSLNYEVRTIDMPSQDGKKACFHPKVSYILLDDGALLTIIGSNNLTVGGWCVNKEIVSFEELKNGEKFPYTQKHQFWDFLKNTYELSGNREFSIAEELIDSFFRQRLHTEGADYSFFSSHKQSFDVFLKGLLTEAGEERFDYIEVISPYLTTGTSLIDIILELSSNNSCYINIPYKALNEVDITEENYKLFQEKGVKWSRLTVDDDAKNFRFNHSKIYRLKTTDKVFTIVGSVNFTNAAWDGRKNANGNIETAIVYEETAADWKPWLEVYDNKDIVFTTEQSNEAEADERIDAPYFNFVLNWQEKTLTYENPESNNFGGEIRFQGHKPMLKRGDQKFKIKLSESNIDELAENPVIKVWQYHVKMELLYYPVQEGFESKPLPAKLKLQDGEIIQLWENVSIDEVKKSEIADLIEKFIMQRQNTDGDLLNVNPYDKSTINMMASHISALIRLQERIFNVPDRKGEYDRARELADYYLFMSNVDTVKGYRNLLEQMFEEKKLLAGTYWFLLHVLVKDFYDKKKVSDFYKSIETCNPGDMENKTEAIKNEILSLASTLDKQMQNNGLNKKLLQWIDKSL